MEYDETVASCAAKTAETFLGKPALMAADQQQAGKWNAG